jgi:hypothetical protein
MNAAPASAPEHRPRAFAVARWSTAAWGALHVLGGALLLATTLGEGARKTLLDLGSAAEPDTIPDEPGSVVESVLGFHALNIVWFGLAALALAWRGDRRSVRDGLFVMAAADVGLVLFLVGPGRMSAAEGVWGPLLLLVAATAFVLSRRTRGSLAPEAGAAR